MGCISHVNLCPASGDTENVLLQKILQSLIAGGGSGGGVTGISVNGGPLLTGNVSIATGSGVQSVNGDAGPIVSLDSGEVPEGANLYFTEARVRSTVLTGLVIAGGAVTAADTVLSALGKYQFRIDALETSALLNFTDETANADGVMWANAGTTEVLRSVGASGFLKTTSARIHRDVTNNSLAILGGIAKSDGAYFEATGDTAASVGFANITTKGQSAGTGSFSIFNAPLASGVNVLRARMTWEGDWSLTPVWNDAADAFVAFDVNPTNTLSAAGALLGRFRASGVSQWEVSKAGATTQLGSGTMTQLRLPNTSSATVGGIYFNSVRAVHNFGTNNFFAGRSAGNLTMTGSENTSVGADTLVALTSGINNTAAGYGSLFANTSGFNNSAFGSLALLATVDGHSNSGFGYFSLGANISGDRNVGFGYSALVALISGDNNIGIGYSAADNLTTGSSNIAIGYNIDSPTATNSNTLTIGNLIFGTALDGTGTTVSSGNIAVGIITPFQKFSVLGAIGAYELATDSSNYSRTSIAPAAGNHLIRTEAAGTGTLRILQVGTGPSTGTNIAGVNSIFHGGQSTGSGAGGSILFQASPAGGAGAGVNALVTVMQITSAFSVDVTGSVSSTAGFIAPNGGNGYRFSSQGFFVSSADGVFKFSNSADTDFGRLQLGGTTSAFPSIKRNGAGIDFRLADDSGYASIATQNITQATAALFSVTSGANQRAGNTTLVGGTVTVSNTTVTANTIVMLTRKTSGGTIGTAITYTVSASTSFTINSDNILDTSVFSYFLIEVP